MQHHRCTRCRNPIRAIAVARLGAAQGEWFHPDCWAEVRSSEQEDYERQVRASGLEALLAPYGTARPLAAGAEPAYADLEQSQA
jgi:hypothetical protein